MKLRQTLAYPVKGYWNGGAKQVFEWCVQGCPDQDDKGQYVRIGSWEANYWFHVAVGKTEKLTLANAKRHLRRAWIPEVPSTFKYV